VYSSKMGGGWETPPEGRENRIGMKELSITFPGDDALGISWERTPQKRAWGAPEKDSGSDLVRQAARRRKPLGGNLKLWKKVG